MCLEKFEFVSIYPVYIYVYYLLFAVVQFTVIVVPEIVTNIDTTNTTLE